MEMTDNKQLLNIIEIQARALEENAKLITLLQTKLEAYESGNFVKREKTARVIKTSEEKKDFIQCNGLLKNGNQCTVSAFKNGRCKRHLNTDNGKINLTLTAIKCLTENCKNKINKGIYCLGCQEAEKKEIEENLREIEEDKLNLYVEDAEDIKEEKQRKARKLELENYENEQMEKINRMTKGQKEKEELYNKPDEEYTDKDKEIQKIIDYIHDINDKREEKLKKTHPSRIYNAIYLDRESLETLQYQNKTLKELIQDTPDAENSKKVKNWNKKIIKNNKIIEVLNRYLELTW